MVKLSNDAESVLFAILDENSYDLPTDPAALPRLAIRCDISLPECKIAARELERAGLAKLTDVVPGRTLTDTIQMTQSGRDAVRELNVVPARGPVAEFALNIDQAAQTVIDTVVQAEQQNAGGAATRSHVRTKVRKAINPKPTIEETNKVIDSLVGSHIVAQGGTEPSYRVTLRGLLASCWGTNALDIIHKVLGHLRELKDKDPALFRYSWGTFRRACDFSSRYRNLAYISVANAKLGNGFFASEGDYWWAPPPELDALVEHETGLEYAREIVGSLQPRQPQTAAATKESDSTGAVAEVPVSVVSRLEQLLQPDLSPVVRAQRAFELLDLHPLIAAACGPLFRNGHYREAVFNASTALITYTKKKAECSDLDGAKLMFRTFSKDNPCLIFKEDESQSNRDEQEGLMHLFVGVVQAIRNPRAHEIKPELHDEALECIVLCSFLAKKLDQAELRRQ